MKQEFNSIELRILGVLIEKSLTTPASYPLTINALVSGANQQQNREPVLTLTDADVSRAVFRLQQYNVVEQAPPTANARSNRYLHCAAERFNWDKREQAVMAELLLRGKQTAGELRNRAVRMAAMPDMQAVHAILDGLINRDSPFAREMQREPGRSTNRYQHLMGEEEAAEVQEKIEQYQNAASPTVSTTTINSDDSDRLAAMESRIESLVSRVEQLEKAIAKPLDDGGGSEV